MPPYTEINSELIKKKHIKQDRKYQQERTEENHQMIQGNRSNKTVRNQQLTSTDLLVWIIVD